MHMPQISIWWILRKFFFEAKGKIAEFVPEI